MERFLDRNFESRRILWWVVCASAAGCLVHAVRAEPLADRPFLQLTRSEFLQADSGEVRDLVEDQAGTLWLATKAGLRRGTDSVGDDVIGGPVNTLSLADDGTVWIGAWNGVYRHHDGKTAAVGRLAGPVTAVMVKGQSVHAAGSTGLHRWTGNSWQSVIDEPPHRALRGIRGIGEFDGRLFLSSDPGLFVVTAGDQANRGSYRRIPMTGQPSASIRSATLIPEDSVLRRQHSWKAVLATSIGVFVGDDQFERLPWIHEDEGTREYPCSDIRGVAWMPLEQEEQLWAATAEGVLVWRFSRDGRRLFPAHRFLHSRRWLPADDVQSLAVGTGGRMHIGTSAGVVTLEQRPTTLAEKDRHYQEVIRARHVRPPGLVERCALRVAGDVSSFEPEDDDNDGEYTGQYLAAQSFQYAVTKDPAAMDRAKKAFDALEFLQTVTGTSHFVARTVVPATWTHMHDGNRTFTAVERAEEMRADARFKQVEVRWRPTPDGRWLWKGDTSSDEITGHMYGYGVYYDLAADDEEKKRVADLVRRIVDGIIEAGYVLRDVDGEPTLWGNWSPERLNQDPLWRSERGCNSVEILSYLLTAWHMTGDDRYQAEIDKLYRDHHYAENILNPRPSDPAGYTYIDDDLLTMAYRALLEYETNPERQKVFRQSLLAWRAGRAPGPHACYDIIDRGLAGDGDGAEVIAGCVDVLRDVPLDMIHWTVDNSRRRDVRIVHRPQGETLQTDRLLPPSELPSLRWDHNVYRVSGGDGGRSEMCPTFWIWSYWMGRYYGFIGDRTP